MEYNHENRRRCCEEDCPREREAYVGCQENGYPERNRRRCEEDGSRERERCSEYSENDYEERGRRRRCEGTHLHEVQGSVQIAESGCDAHNHRFATVSDKAVSIGQGDHAHDVVYRTDSYEGHFHEFCGRTTGEFPICGGHVHYLAGMTNVCDGHSHCFKMVTHIEEPTSE